MNILKDNLQKIADVSISKNKLVKREALSVDLKEYDIKLLYPILDKGRVNYEINTESESAKEYFVALKATSRF